MESLIQTVKDNNLKLTLSFGIALHHAGLHERDRKIAEELFVNQKIQVREYTGVKRTIKLLSKPSGSLFDGWILWNFTVCTYVTFAHSFF